MLALSLALLLGWYELPSAEAPLPGIARDLQTHGIPGAVHMDGVALHLALKAAVEGTPFANRWVVNAPRPHGQLGIYIIDSRASSPIDKALGPYVMDNAAFIPSDTAIIVDYRLIDSLARRYYPSDQSWGSRAFLLFWVIGHEVGHLALHHSLSDFATGSQLEPPRRCPSQDQELAADAYFGDELVRSTQPREVLRRLFIEILANERRHDSQSHRQRLAGWLRRWWQPHMCAHPVMVVRAYRILRRLNQAAPDASVSALLSDIEADGWTR